MNLQRAALGDLSVFARSTPYPFGPAILAFLLWIEALAAEMRAEGLRVGLIAEAVKPMGLILAVQPYGLNLP